MERVLTNQEIVHCQKKKSTARLLNGLLMFGVFIILLHTFPSILVHIPKEKFICPESTDLNIFANGGLNDIQTYFPHQVFIYKLQGVRALLGNHRGCG